MSYAFPWLLGPAKLETEYFQVRPTTDRILSQTDAFLLTKEYGASHGSRGTCRRNNERDEPFCLSRISLGIFDLCYQSKFSKEPSAIRSRYHHWIRFTGRIRGSGLVKVFLLERRRKTCCALGDTIRVPIFSGLLRSLLDIVLAGRSHHSYSRGFRIAVLGDRLVNN